MLDSGITGYHPENEPSSYRKFVGRKSTPVKMTVCARPMGTTSNLVFGINRKATILRTSKAFGVAL